MDLVVPTGPEVEPGNVACAVAAALSLGVPAATVAARLASLPGAPNRRRAQQGANGARIIDDTYNANPAGARAALALLGVIGRPEGKRVVVTPGMVELGRLQGRENANFAAECRGGGHRTRRGRPHQRPVPDGRGQGRRCTRPACPGPQGGRGWVSAQLGALDAVLYENDLPDHYP